MQMLRKAPSVMPTMTTGKPKRMRNDDSFTLSAASGWKMGSS